MALLGILLVHAHDFFNAHAAVSPAGWWDCVLDWVYGNLLHTKAFFVFSFLFGLSFFLQMDHAEARGIDFRGRFCWRLVLLAGFGIIHSFFYTGDILLIFALAGFIPVLLWKVRTRTIVLLAVFCLLHPLDWAFKLTGNAGTWWDGWRAAVAWLGLTPMPDSAMATFWQMDSWNLTNGLFFSWLYTIFSHRIWDIAALFMLGLVAGRERLFERSPERLLRLSAYGLLGYILLLLLTLLPDAGFRSNLLGWLDISYVCFFLPLLAWLFARPAAAPFLAPLVSIGRCTLTCYMTQSMVMLWVICGYGLGWGAVSGTAGIMGVALLLYGVQVVACMAWLRFFRYGPLEGIWRYLTKWGMKGNQPAARS